MSSSDALFWWLVFWYGIACHFQYIESDWEVICFRIDEKFQESTQRLCADYIELQLSLEEQSGGWSEGISCEDQQLNCVCVCMCACVCVCMCACVCACVRVRVTSSRWRLEGHTGKRDDREFGCSRGSGVFSSAIPSVVSDWTMHVYYGTR